MKSQVLHTVWCYISSEAAGEIWHWSFLGVKGLKYWWCLQLQRIVARTCLAIACAVFLLSPVSSTTRRPMLLSVATATWASLFTVSATAIIPTSEPANNSHNHKNKNDDDGYDDDHDDDDDNDDDNDGGGGGDGDDGDGDDHDDDDDDDDPWSWWWWWWWWWWRWWLVSGLAWCAHRWYWSARPSVPSPRAAAWRPPSRPSPPDRSAASSRDCRWERRTTSARLPRPRYCLRLEPNGNGVRTTERRTRRCKSQHTGKQHEGTHKVTYSSVKWLQWRHMKHGNMAALTSRGTRPKWPPWRQSDPLKWPPWRHPGSAKIAAMT